MNLIPQSTRSVLLIFSILLLRSDSAIRATGPEGKPNILFIAADDLRPQLGCYGYTQMITPHLDALARRGLVFERAYCQAATCRASRLSLLTGMRPDSTRIHTN
ncbi:MAG: sulfatase-like hydrolase/transferase, partial [Fuerstiella sp.]|nr:sulfatase-like hydrolase/transferase [Fuerstiella sp.]